MAGKTYTFTVNSTGAKETVTVQGDNQSQVVVKVDASDAAWPGVEFNIYEPSGSTTPIRVPIGGSYIFSVGAAHRNTKVGLFRTNEVLADIETVSGSYTFAQIEST